jgi:hypothetical protein
MMIRVLVPFVAAVLGAVLGAGLTSSSAPADVSLLPVDGAVEIQLDELGTRVESLERKNDVPVLRARGDAKDRSRAALQALARRVAALEKRTTDPITPRDTDADASPEEAVLARARSLGWNKAKAGSRVAAWREVLALPDVTDELRFEALSHVGWGLRELKRHDEAAEAYRRLADLAGSASTKGARALYDLSWSRWHQKNTDGAYRVMAECARAKGTDRVTRRAAFYHAADWAQSLDYRDDARDHANELLRMTGDRDDKSNKKFADYARSILASVGGR